MTMTVLANLQLTKRLLQDKKRWTQRALARARFRHEVSPFKKEATCFCLSGALYRTYYGINNEPMFNPHSPPAMGLVRNLSRMFFGESLEDVNDNQGYAKVMELLDKAIEQEQHPTVVFFNPENDRYERPFSWTSPHQASQHPRSV